ncbi:MAG: hypothetical protein U1F37_04150 [Alphaproteobacteria bacterium]
MRGNTSACGACARGKAPSFAEALLAMPQDGGAFPRAKVRPRDLDL